MDANQYPALRLMVTLLILFTCVSYLNLSMSLRVKPFGSVSVRPCTLTTEPSIRNESRIPFLWNRGCFAVCRYMFLNAASRSLMAASGTHLLHVVMNGNRSRLIELNHFLIE